MEYKIGDIISVPKHGDLEINKEVLYLFEGFLKYDTKYCIILIKGYSEGYPYLLNLDIKIFLHLCYTHDYKKYKEFFKSLYNDFPCNESACILQLISHRIFETEGYTKELEKNLSDSIYFFENKECHKWRISGKFFLGLYSGDETIIFKNFIDCLNTEKLFIDMDCYQDKIGYIVSWLRCKQPEKSKIYLEKLYDKLEEFGYHYSQALDPLIKYHNTKELEEHLEGYDSYNLWNHVNNKKNNMKYQRVCILGSTGLVGSNLYRKYLEKYPGAVILAPKRYNLDLENREQVIGYFIKNKPDLVFMCAAKVGGIKANNDYKADFITTNLKIQTNVIEACHLSKVDKLVFLGSSCIYPKNSEIPIREEYLMTGHLETTNDAYAIAKISGIKMCQSYRQQYGDDYISVMPCNLYGPGDNFNLDSSHVLPALIRKFHEAKEADSSYVEVWGTGKPMREFLYVDDLAEALIHLSENYSSEDIINVGSGNDISISDLSLLISEVVGYKGKIKFNYKYPDGTYRKVMDVSKIFETGWRPSHTIEEGIKKTYEYYKNTICRLEKRL